MIIGGIIPLLFSIFVVNFFLKDDRAELFASANYLDKNANLTEGSFVKFSGIISEKNNKIKDNYILAVREKFMKGVNGKRSEWIGADFYLQPIRVQLNESFEIEALVANDYSPCGDQVKISDLEVKKSRVLGIPANVSVSAVGKITKLDPIQIQTSHSLCTGTIEDYQNYLNKKLLGYLFLLFCIALPSLGLIYLGLFKVNREKTS